MIPLYKPYISDKAREYTDNILAKAALASGEYSQMARAKLTELYGFKNIYLTTTGTGALDLLALLLDLKPDDEIIVPSYTFVSTAGAFARCGARIVFADSGSEHPNITTESCRSLITAHTKAIIVMHYGGVLCDMKAFRGLAEQHGILLLEDAAHALGTPGVAQHSDAAIVSFDHTKNITAGQGGMLVLNNADLLRPAELAYERGTDRAAYFRGELDFYQWQSHGSGFAMSEMNAALLAASLCEAKSITDRRLKLWQHYGEKLQMPPGTADTVHNGHIFYVVTGGQQESEKLIKHLANAEIEAALHYQPLHRSEFNKSLGDIRPLPQAEHFAATLVRLPLYFELETQQVDYICEKINELYK